MNLYSKYERHEEIGSMYYYKDDPVLKNKLNIRDEKKLSIIETDIAYHKIMELELFPINGRFSMNHLLRIHRFIFQEIYPFAGNVRYEEISKGETLFCEFSKIKTELTSLLLDLKKEHYLKDYENDIFWMKLADYMANLNIIHPFREGNGRAIREFIRELALNNGYHIDWINITKEELLKASIESVDDSTHLKLCLMRCVADIE
jgi:cell filamentation protein